MQLSKLVPARRKTLKFDWCEKDWMVMSRVFRNVRGTSTDKMDHCFWCHHKFEDGEMMSRAQPEMMSRAQPDKPSHRVLCATCADELLATKEG